MNNIKIVKPPNRELPITGSKKVFLAGSIDMGSATDWQKDLENFLTSIASDENKITVYNPRRDDWDSSWTQSIDNDQFYNQVSWELDHIEKSDIIVIYFEEDSKSPITLLELGKVLGNIRVVVYCPKNFYRKGNVDILCYRKNTPVFETVDELKKELKSKLGIGEDNGNTEDENPEDVNESVCIKEELTPTEEPTENKIKIKTFSEAPELTYKNGNANKLIVEDLEKIEDSCMMGKLKFMGREFFGGICTENGVSKISLNVDIGNTGKGEEREFIIEKATERDPEGIVIN